VLERRDVLGGAAVTEPVWPGYRVSLAAYVCSLLDPQVIADLDVETDEGDEEERQEEERDVWASGHTKVMVSRRVRRLSGHVTTHEGAVALSLGKSE